jgi:hypothetical protein
VKGVQYVSGNDDQVSALLSRLVNPAIFSARGSLSYIALRESRSVVKASGGAVMDIRAWFVRRPIATVALCLVCLSRATAADDSTLTREQIGQFLLTAKIVGAKQSSKGITHTVRLTLSDGKTTHDASYQSIDEFKASRELPNGGAELNFVDSYKYNLAAYALAEMLGIEDMLPVYVERKYKGDAGSLSWWLPVKMDEADRLKQNLEAPDSDAWNSQMYRVRVFDELIYDTDANLTNVLIGEDWKIWRIDFTRAFRISKDLRDSKNLVRCDRHLLEKLRTLDGNQLSEKTKRYLSKDAFKAVMARRDKIVAHFDKLISEKGDAAVLY